MPGYTNSPYPLPATRYPLIACAPSSQLPADRLRYPLPAPSSQLPAPSYPLPAPGSQLPANRLRSRLPAPSCRYCPIASSSIEYSLSKSITCLYPCSVTTHAVGVS